MRLIISPERRAEVISRYVGGDRPKNIAVALGINDWNVSNIVRRSKCARSQVDAQQLILARGEWIGNRRYSIDHSAFSSITPDAAYWCGFLMADGCVIGNKVHIKLAIKDVGHLEKFRVFVKADTQITIDDGQQMRGIINGRVIRSDGTAFITVTSPQIVRDLAAVGVTERKTFSARTCGLEMNRDFWRGAIDGDGSVVLGKGKPYLSLIGSQPLMTQFLAFCKSITSTNVSVRPAGNIFKVYMSSGPACAVINAIYRDAATSLDRKAAKAELVLEAFRHSYHEPYL